MGKKVAGNPTTVHDEGLRVFLRSFRHAQDSLARHLSALSPRELVSADIPCCALRAWGPANVRREPRRIQIRPFADCGASEHEMEVAAAGIREDTAGAAEDDGVAAFRQLGAAGRQEVVVTIDPRWIPVNGIGNVYQ